MKFLKLAVDFLNVLLTFSSSTLRYSFVPVIPFNIRISLIFSKVLIITKLVKVLLLKFHMFQLCVSYKPAPLPPPSPSLSLIQSRISETFVMIISKNVFLDQNFKKKTFQLIFSAVLEEYHRQFCYVSLSFTKKLQLSPQFLALCVLCSVSSCYTKFCFDSDVWLICNLA